MLRLVQTELEQWMFVQRARRGIIFRRLSYLRYVKRTVSHDHKHVKLNMIQIYVSSVAAYYPPPKRDVLQTNQLSYSVVTNAPPSTTGVSSGQSGATVGQLVGNGLDIRTNGQVNGAVGKLLSYLQTEFTFQQSGDQIIKPTIHLHHCK